MNENNNNVWRKLVDEVSNAIFYIAVVLVAVAFVIGVLFVGALINGAIISTCWNVAMTTMFGFSKIRMFQAFVLAFTIGCLRTNYFGSAKSEYEDTKRKLLQKGGESKKKAEIMSILLVIIFELIQIIIIVAVTKYSWNNILPQILNVELVEINFWQSLGFAYLFNLLFSNSGDKKTKDSID